MARTRKKSTRRKYSRERKYSKKKKYRKSNLKQNRKKNKKRNMKGGVVKIFECGRDEAGEEKEIFVLREGDEETEPPEGSLVIKDNDIHDWLREDGINQDNLKGWIIDGLNKQNPGFIEDKTKITVYKKNCSDEFISMNPDIDGTNDINLYVGLPPLTPPVAPETPVAVGTPDTSEKQTGKLASLNMPPSIRTGGYTPRDSSAGKLDKLRKIKIKVETIYPGEFLGTALIKFYNRRYNVTLDELKSIYEIYITDEDINKTNQYGDTMLGTAVYLKNYDIFQYLVNIPGINLNDNYSTRNPLFLAINGKDYHMIDLISSLNASDPIIDVNVKNEIGETPLFALYGQMRKHEDKGLIIEMLKKLIDMGADKHAENYMGRTLLQQAIYDKGEAERYSGNEDYVKQLIHNLGEYIENLDKLITYLRSTY